MAWTGLALTVDGRNALTDAQLTGKMQIKAVVVGDGAPPANFNTLKGLVHQLYSISEIKVDRTEKGCTVTADFPTVNFDYYFREVGVVIETDQGDKLYVYDNCGDDAQHIVSSTGAESTRKRLRLSLIISDVAEITISNSSILYVGYDDFETALENLGQTIGDNDTKQREALDAVRELLKAAIDTHTADKNDPHDTTKAQVGLGNADNTADVDKPVSGPQQAALDAYYAQSIGYADQRVADLINGAPSTLDTLGEIAQAMQENEDVVEALEDAIGSKASAAEFDSHTKDDTKHITSAERTKWNDKMETAGDSANNTVTFSSGDDARPSGWADIEVMTSGEKHSSLFRKMSLAVKNLRYLWRLLGTTSLAGIGDGTVTGAISSLNTGLYSMVRYIYMGEYDYTVVDLNDVAKDIFARLPTTGKFYIGKCIVGSNYDFIACNSSLSFGFICFFSYNIDGVYIYKRVLGKTYRQVAQWEVTAI